MNITFILPGYSKKPSGGYKAVYEYANRLVKKGHNVNIFYPHYLKKWNKSEKITIKNYIRSYFSVRFKNIFRPKLDWFELDQNINEIFGLEPLEKNIPDSDVVIATFWVTAFYINEYSQKKGRKFYFVMDFYPYLGEKSELEATWNLDLKKITISKWLTEMVINSGVNSDSIVTIPCGIDDNLYKLNSSISNRSKMITMMYNNTSSYKAPNDGLKAIEVVKKKYPDIKVNFFGPGDRPDIIPEWINYYSNISNKDLVSLYNKTSIFVSSSLAEGFALPPAEAMACGCAIVSTDSGGIREYAQDNVNCLLSSPNRSDLLANNIIKLIKNDILRIKLAKKGNKMISNFTWNRSADIFGNYLLNGKF